MGRAALGPCDAQDAKNRDPPLHHRLRPTSVIFRPFPIVRNLLVAQEISVPIEVKTPAIFIARSRTRSRTLLGSLRGGGLLHGAWPACDIYAHTPIVEIDGSLSWKKQPRETLRHAAGVEERESVVKVERVVGRCSPREKLFDGASYRPLVSSYEVGGASSEEGDNTKQKQKQKKTAHICKAPVSLLKKATVRQGTANVAPRMYT